MSPPVFPSLHSSLQSVLTDRMGWAGLREVQEQAYRAILEGNDVLVIAPTAGGKSEAALIPVLDDILKTGAPGIACLYIAPLKALINDQEERISRFCLPVGLSLARWHGDVPRGDRRWKDGDAPQFLLITPESLEVLLHEPTAIPALASLRYVIVDELHAFVESERGVHLRVLLDRLDRIAAAPVQRIGLSATVGNPEEVLAWFSGNRRKIKVVAAPAPPSQKTFRFIVEPDPQKRIDALVRLVTGKKALVFVNSRSTAESILQETAGRITNLHIHHSSVAPATRKGAEEAFSGSGGACIICTSTLELGIDIGDLEVVVQVGSPDSVSSFLQRMGRTGRRDRSAYVAWLLAHPAELLASCAVIECAQQKQTERLHPPEKPWNVLVQQLFLAILTGPRAGRATIIRNLRSFPVFARFSIDEIDRLLEHLINAGYLSTDGDLLVPGHEAERAFGLSHIRELYSVIAGNGEYRAVTPDGEVVGTVDARFAHREEPGDFMLGGATWSVVKCDESHNLVVVVPGGSVPGTSRVFRSAGGEAALSAVICTGIQRIVARGKSTLPLSEADAEMLGRAISAFPQGIGESGLFVRAERSTEGRVVSVYSFAGRRFNRVLAYLLKGMLDRVQARYDDCRVRILRAGKTGGAERVTGVLREIPALSEKEVSAFLPLPAPDPWKFARMLSEEEFRAMIAADYHRTGDVLQILAQMPVTILPAEEPGPEADE